MKKTNLKVGGTVAMLALALGATGALAHGSDVKRSDPRQAVPMEEVVLVAKDGVLAGGTGGGSGNGNCGFIGTFIGNNNGNVVGGGSIINLLNLFGQNTNGNCN
ncbi:MAG: hypothetical protein EOO71_32340 [Myxococcaceae bacterium]|nr:MAG: hypothetical protein EOO71_32340 [Myxococcaceae bacterium]